jgi:hypothetical protein
MRQPVLEEIVASVKKRGTLESRAQRDEGLDMFF